MGAIGDLRGRCGGGTMPKLGTVQTIATLTVVVVWAICTLVDTWNGAYGSGSYEVPSQLSNALYIALALVFGLDAGPLLGAGYRALANRNQSPPPPSVPPTYQPPLAPLGPQTPQQPQGTPPPPYVPPAQSKPPGPMGGKV